MPFRKFLFALSLLVFAMPGRGGHFMHDTDTTVAILMFDGVQIIDFSAPYEVFGQARFNVYTVSADGAAVTTAMGLNVNVDFGFDDAPDADVIVVPGGDVDATRADGATLAWIRERAGNADQVFSICTGSFILAEAGLLDGGSATTFHRAFGNFQEEFPAVTLVRDQRWVDSGRVVTSAGLASGIDAALHVVAERLGERKARSIALHLEYDWSPEQGFVRGLMADRHIRMPEKDFEFPEATEIDTVTQVGDRDHWEIEYRVESPWSAEELMAHVTRRASADPALTVIEDLSPLSAGWRYEAEHGGRWQLEFAAIPDPESPSFTVMARLSRAD